MPSNKINESFGPHHLGEIFLNFEATAGLQPSAAPALPLYRHLYAQVIFAVIAGISVGFFFPEFGSSLKPLGDAFVALVKMIIAPVIFLTVATGLGGMSNVGKIGSVFGKALAYFVAVSTLALIIGLIALARLGSFPVRLGPSRFAWVAFFAGVLLADALKKRGAVFFISRC